MRSFADPSPGMRDAWNRADKLNRRKFEEEKLASERRVADLDRRMRIAAERRLNEIAQVNRAKFAEQATEQAIRALGNEIGKRFADRLERIGENPPRGMDARMLYHIAEQVFRDNLDVTKICKNFGVVLDREIGRHHPLRSNMDRALRDVVEQVAHERLGLWMLPPDVQEWFSMVMKHAEPEVIPRISYAPCRGDELVAESMIKVEVIWPRDVLAYNVSLGR
jgi:hypothetical protein